MRISRTLAAVAAAAFFVPMSGAAGAGTVSQDRSFVLGFSDDFSASTTLDFDPFAGSSADLTAVTLDFNSRLIITESDAGDMAAGLYFGATLRPQILVGPVALGSSDLSWTGDLLALGIAPSEFVGSSVSFFLSFGADEGTASGIWYAGTDVPFVGLGDFGNVTLTYEFASPTAVPLPGGLPLLLGAMALLIGRHGVRRRMRA